MYFRSNLPVFLPSSLHLYQMVTSKWSATSIDRHYDIFLKIKGILDQNKNLLTENWNIWNGTSFETLCECVNFSSERTCNIVFTWDVVTIHEVLIWETLCLLILCIKHYMDLVGINCAVFCLQVCYTSAICVSTEPCWIQTCDSKFHLNPLSRFLD